MGIRWLEIYSARRVLTLPFRGLTRHGLIWVSLPKSHPSHTLAEQETNSLLVLATPKLYLSLRVVVISEYCLIVSDIRFS